MQAIMIETHIVIGKISEVGKLVFKWKDRGKKVWVTSKSRFSIHVQEHTTPKKYRHTLF